MTKRTYTHETLFQGEHWSRHGSYELAQKEIRKVVSRFAWNADDFTIRKIEGA
jgi:hypothetical protein